MPLSSRQLLILTALRRYFYLRTAQLRDLIAPNDKDGSITRECLRKLLHLGFVRRHEPRILEQGRATAPPIFVLTMKGANSLAAETGDCALLLSVEPTFRDWMSLHHFCALSQFHMTVDAAVAAQNYVKQTALYFEHEVIQPEKTGGERYKLHTPTGAGIFCCPDSAFELDVQNYRRAWYVEREMGSDAPGRIAAKKCKGYAGLFAQKLFTRHFPQAKDFRVLAICPNAGWRDQLRKEMKAKPGAELWLFAAVTELTPETVLHQPVYYKTEGEGLPLVKAPAATLATPSGGGVTAGGTAGGGKYV